MVRPVNAWSAAAFCALALLANSALAQSYAVRTIEIEGETIQYGIRAFAPGANAVDGPAKLEPTSALDTAKLIGRHLAAGSGEDAAMLSNSPRRRFEVLRDYKDSVGEDGFKQVYAEYFDPRNQVLAEIAIGEHSLLVWHLREANRYAGQFFVRMDGRTLMDDVPSPARVRLRKLLEAVRDGRLALP